MRSLLVAAVSLLSVVLSAAPAVALDLMVKHDARLPVVPVADLDHATRARTHRYQQADAYWHWRYRAAYTRWMHNEYVRAGYPVRPRHSRTYVRAEACHGCERGRHW
jgi:hypothetical protein